MKCYAFFVFMTAIFIEAAGSDVVIGILGNSVFIDCKLPLAESLIWESPTVGVIAISSELVVRRTSKYAVERHNGARESLVIHDVSLTDEDEYRCYSVHDKHDVYVTYLTVLGHLDDNPVVAKKVNTMVYVAGGLISFTGLMIIVSIVILLARNRCKNTNLCPTSPFEEALSNRRRHNPAIGEKWWYTIRPSNRPDLNAKGNSTPAASRKTRNGIQVVCSTPYYGNKQAIFNVEGNSPILPEDNHHIQQALQIIQTPESFDFSSFGVHPLTYDSNSNAITGQFLTINTLHSDAYTQNGSVFYKTIDDTVNKSVGEGLEDLKHKIADAQPKYMCAVTLDKDYSAGDIADILDITELYGNDITLDLDKPNSDIVLDGTSLSFNVDFSESDVCAQFSNMSPTEFNSSRDFIDSDCIEDDTNSLSFNSTLGSQQSFVLADSITFCNTTSDTKTMNQTCTVPKVCGHPVQNSKNEIESDMSATLRSDLLHHWATFSKRTSTFLDQRNGQYFERTVPCHCCSNTDSSSDHCDEDLCDVDQCILTLTNDSNHDSLEVEYDTIISNETPLRSHSRFGVNRVISTKLRNNSFRTALDNSMVDNTTIIPTGYTTKLDISATVMEMEETIEGTGFKNEDLLQHMTILSKRNSTYLNQDNGQYFERTVSFQCGSNTDSSSDHCDEDLCDVDQCILTLTNDSNQDSLELEFDTIIAKETPLRSHSSCGVNRVISTKLRNNSFRTAIENSMVDTTTTIPTGYTTKLDTSATVMEMEKTKEGTRYKHEDHTVNFITSTRDGVAFF